MRASSRFLMRLIACPLGCCKRHFDVRARGVAEQVGEFGDLKILVDRLPVDREDLGGDGHFGCLSLRSPRADGQLTIRGYLEIESELGDDRLDRVACAHGVERADDDGQGPTGRTEEPTGTGATAPSDRQSRASARAAETMLLPTPFPNRSPRADSTSRCYQYLTGVKQRIGLRQP
jgi:hypothetical protein